MKIVCSQIVYNIIPICAIDKKHKIYSFALVVFVAFRKKRQNIGAGMGLSLDFFTLLGVVASFNISIIEDRLFTNSLQYYPHMRY